ncbi:N-acetylmuramoyl-L-alanine amidase LytC [Anoxybacillus sp. P3H1B]|uniref:SH3 domain-containing protein n=1 Tax=Anoxybacillus sp. P3H1B TaxID=1769293 RepID=UPI00079B5F2E|nr:SH3 domain-containing protein [Anoxybacillus sp. P3H1B]KXG08984.1 N-acetylmuramoyl-L-alanine amidase LytC [Anoxybacillus sp. P3H1B]
MKKWITSTIVATCCIWPTFASADDSSSKQYPVQMITDEAATLRKGATTSYPIVTSVPSGKQVLVIDEFTNASGELWYRVQFDNFTGWILAEQLTAQKETNVGNLMITSETATLRKGATTSYPIVTSVPLGKQVLVIDEFTNAAGELWYRVQFDNFTGWIWAKQLTLQKTNIGKLAVALENGVALRKGASSSYEVVQTLRNGEIVQIIDEYTNSLNETYYRVDISGKKGWIRTNQLYVSDHLPEKLPTYYSVGQTALVRRGASDTYQTVATISKGQTIAVIDLFVTTTKHLWYRIDTEKIKGWVPEETLKNAVVVAAPNGLDSQQQTKTYQLSISVSVANVRQSPSTNAKVLTQLKNGVSLTGVDISTDSQGAKWYKVVLSNNQVGWVHETVVQVKSTSTSSNTIPSSQKKAVVTNGAVVYESPSFKAQIIEKIPKNIQVTMMQTVNDTSFNWIKVTSSTGKIGWMPEFEISTPKYVYAATSSVPLRRGASESYAVVRNLGANERLLYLYSYNGWIYVETSSGIRGWVPQGKTSTVATNSLIQPKLKTSGTDRYIEWSKTNNFSVSYSILSDNRLKITGGFSHSDIPTFKIEGIKSIEQVDSSLILTFSPGYTFTIRNYGDRISIKILETGLKGKKIIIDAGHGGHDTGAIGPTGLKEKDINLDTALLLKAELEKYGAIVKLTRSTDVFLELAERTTIANSSDYDAFISIHADSYSSTSSGTTTYYNVSTNFNGPKSVKLAQYVQKYIVSQLGTSNRGYKEQEFYVNRKNELPSILVELAFVSNPKEEALLKTKAFRQKAAAGIRQGLEEYFNNF